MAATRQTTIPILHVLAEVAALPLASEIALQLALTELDPRLESNGPTAELWRQGEGHLLRSFPGVGVDEVVAVRDRTWFREVADAQPLPLGEYTHLLVNRFLVAEGNVARPWLGYLPTGDDRTDPDRKTSGRTGEAEDRRDWRWMSFALPTDLLLAALQPDSPPHVVQLLSPAVANLLREHGYAETHLHLGAALDFPTLWATATCRIGRYDLPSDAFRSPGAGLREGRDLAPWLVRACLARFLLGAYLNWGRYQPGTPHLAAFLAPQGPVQQVVDLLQPELHLSLQEALHDLHAGRLARRDNFRALQQAYQKLTQVSLARRPRRLADVQRLDPLYRWFPADGIDGPTVEIRFLAEALLYLRRQPYDGIFATLFWQATRVRALMFRHCIQRPMTPGLQYFIRFYERKTPITQLLGSVELESAGRLCGVGRGLKSLEVRISPRRNADEQLRELISLRDQFHALYRHRYANLEFGVVVHYLKSRGEPHNRGVPPAFDAQGAADPAARANPRRFRYSGAFLKWWAETRAISTALSKRPELLEVLRGFDICRDESSIPTWVYTPLFRKLDRDASETARACGIATPRRTVHVGEDFVHLTSGLRAMDEALRHLQLRSGDRVGHGLALGVDPLPWARKTVYVPMAREDRWLDLVWEYQVQARDGVRSDPQRRAEVEREIMALSRTIFGPQGEQFHSPHDAALLVEMLFDVNELAAIGFPDGELPTRPRDVRQALLIDYLTNPNLFHRARKTEWVRAEDEGEAIAALQQAVRRNYAEAGITIETNPISNLLVGDLGDLTSHPLWRLSSPTLDPQVAPIPLCIGSDDPLPFVTSLPEEYQFLHDALILAGRTHAEARAWLDRVRVAGLEAHFTVASVSRRVSIPKNRRN